MSLATAAPGARTATRSERDAVVFHVGYGAVAALGLALPLDVPSGWRMATLVAVYLYALPTAARRLGHRDWIEAFRFLLPLSALQVLPDWFLAEVLGVLVFPDDGFPKIGAVSAYMAGLWTIPLFVAVRAGDAAAARRGPGAGAAVSAAVALVVFGVSEETLWAVPVWHATGVATVGHTAVYVLVPEMLLGALAWDANRRAAGRGLGARLALAVPVMLAYAGALAVSFLLVERVLR